VKLPSYSIRLIKQAPDRLKLKGLLATSDDHKTLIGLVKASFPSADIIDRIRIAEAPDADIKLGGVSYALRALGLLHAGSAVIDKDGVSLTGATESSAVYAEMRRFLDAGPPTGVALKQIEIAAPQQTFFWRADVGNGQVRLTGAVPDSNGKKQIETVTQKLFSDLTVVDQTTIAEGAPPSWLDAAVHSLEVLRLLEAGFVQMADHAIRLDGRVSDEAALRKIDAMADKYPRGFSLESKVSAQERTGLFVIPKAAAAERSPLEPAR
jgi:hypothetical protein